MNPDWTIIPNRLTAAFSQFLEAASQLDPAARERAGVCGFWSPKDVMAHLVGWDLEAARRLRAFMAGRTTDITYDLDAFNAGSVVARQHLSWEQTLAELRSAHQTLQEAILAVTDQDVATEPRISEWIAGRSGDYEEHTVQLRQWLEKNDDGEG